MAQITGSSTIDWSGISLAQVDFETDIVRFVNRVDEILFELVLGNFFPISASPTLIVVELFSGGILSLGGSGFNTSPILKSFNFSNADTGEVVRFTGILDGGNETLTSATIGETGFSETINGNITVPETFPAGNYSGTVTSLVVKIGSATGTISGSFILTGDNSNSSLTGTVSAISVVSGANTIKMTGLSLSLGVLGDALASGDLATVNDLFSVVGNQLAGNDVITYNSPFGVALFGGAGNDTITGGTGPDMLHGDTGNDLLNGAGGTDTLDGGDGDDILLGGLGQDSIMGGLGNDQITMLVTAGNVDTIDAGDDNDTLLLSGVVPGNHVVVVDLSSLTDQVVSIGGVADALAQINFENLNASGIGSSVIVTGSAGDNIIIGSSGNDIIAGGAGNDTINGGLGADSMTGGLGDDTYTIDNLGDSLSELADEGIDTVRINRSVDLNLPPSLRLRMRC